IVDPQSAVLTNIEVLAYLTANPPRRPPNPPPNSRNWVPSPDLRDHNTVVKEIHNYISRLSPHVQDYPRYTPAATQQAPQRAPLNEHMPIDDALRDLITQLQPYGLTKGEVLMIVNLGVGVQAPPAGEGEGEEGEGEGEGEAEDGGQGDAEMTNGTGTGTGEEMEVDGDADAEGGHVEGAEGAEGAGEGEEEVPEEDYGPLALLDTVIEERDERLSDADVRAVLAIIRETLGSKG
ncbi:hypothetical protein P170DRAFT_349793, partial [Aspergillus steynii IBT 23096]